ncbi:velvet factor-domain-containing protein [Mycena vitilis]|nr:velvet factor-domain-containing protein [Mycena vitilis]
MNTPAHSNTHYSELSSAILLHDPLCPSVGNHPRYPVHRLERGHIGRPIQLAYGQFAGKTIRATLQEMQAPVFGRKTVSVPREAKVDRRPLDPPPVAWLRLFEVFNLGTLLETEAELGYDNINLSGFICGVELINDPSPGSPNPTNYLPGRPHAMPEPAETSCKATEALAGMTFVQAASIPWKGRTCLLFTFNDLAVKIEGFFTLKYRFFDLFSAPRGQVDPPIMAECSGARFRVYSTRDCPSLEKSTELSKHLARCGVPLNVRETERKRRRNKPIAVLPYTTQKLHDSPRSEDRSEDDYMGDGDD